jgi:hypothetical protein
MTATAPNHKIDLGRNAKRFREMIGTKRDALTYDLNDDCNLQKIPLLE